MLIGEEVTQRHVYDEWTLVDKEEELKRLSADERKQEMDRLFIEHKRPVKEGLPKDLIWHKATIEEGDASNIYIMTESGWVEEFGQDTNILSVASLVDSTGRGHSGQIKEMQNHLEGGLQLETMFIMVARDQNGPFTIIDGNHRLTAFCLANRLVGLEGYVGSSPRVVNLCPWTGLTPRSAIRFE